MLRGRKNIPELQCISFQTSTSTDSAKHNTKQNLLILRKRTVIPQRDFKSYSSQQAGLRMPKILNEFLLGDSGKHCFQVATFPKPQLTPHAPSTQTGNKG